MSGNGVDALEGNPTWPSPLLSLQSFEGSTSFREGCWAEPRNKRWVFAYKVPWCSEGKGIRRTGLSCVYVWWRQELRDNTVAIDVDLALSDVHPSHSSLFKSHRGCAYTVSKVYPLIDVGQTGRNGKEGAMRSVIAEGGGVHECVTDGYSS